MKTSTAGCLLSLTIFATASVASADEDACSGAHIRAQVLKRDAPEKLIERRAALRACSSQLCARSIVDSCSAWLREVDALVPSLTISAVDSHGSPLADATISVDGKTQAASRAVELNPGEHAVTVTTARLTESRKLVLRPGEKDRQEQIIVSTPTVNDDATRDNRGSRWPAIAALGIGAAGFVTSAVLGIFWVKDQSNAGCQNPSRCPSGFDSTSANANLHHLAIGFWMGAAVAAAGGGIGSWLLLSTGGQSRNAQQGAANPVRPLSSHLSIDLGGIEGSF